MVIVQRKKLTLGFFPSTEKINCFQPDQIFTLTIFASYCSINTLLALFNKKIVTLNLNSFVVMSLLQVLVFFAQKHPTFLEKFCLFLINCCKSLIVEIIFLVISWNIQLTKTFCLKIWIQTPHNALIWNENKSFGQRNAFFPPNGVIITVFTDFQPSIETKFENLFCDIVFIINLLSKIRCHRSLNALQLWLSTDSCRGKPVPGCIAPPRPAGRDPPPHRQAGGSRPPQWGAGRRPGPPSDSASGSPGTPWRTAHQGCTQTCTHTALQPPAGEKYVWDFNLSWKFVLTTLWRARVMFHY